VERPKAFSYKILSELGRGTTGTVYEAWNDLLKRRVAIKVPHPATEAEHSSTLRQFMHECQALASLTSAPNCGIPCLYEVGEHQPRYVMYARELVDGNSLEKSVTEGSLNLHAGLAIIAQVAQITHRVHTQGLVHQNLSPANVLVGRDGTPWLIGFGRVSTLSDELAEVDSRGLQQLLLWLCETLRQPVPNELQHDAVFSSTTTPFLMSEAIFRYLGESNDGKKG
jgi:serine/threonine protein kinase